MFEVSWFAVPEPFVFWHVALVALAFFIGALLIGLLGVAGGVIYVPALLMLPGMTAGTAVSTSMLAAVPMSASRLAQLIYYKRLKCREALPMLLAAAVVAAPGQLLVPHVPKAVILGFTGFLSLYAGIRMVMASLREARQKQASAAAAAEPQCTVPDVTDVPEVVDEKQIEVEAADAVDEEKGVTAEEKAKPDAPQDAEKTWLSQLRFVLFGAVTAFLSSVSGTGGPILGVALYLMVMPPLEPKNMMALMTPLAGVVVTSSAAGGLLFSTPDVGLALVLGAANILGVLLGGMLQEKIPAAIFKKLVSAVLLGFGCYLIIRVGMKLAA